MQWASPRVQQLQRVQLSDGDSLHVSLVAPGCQNLQDNGFPPQAFGGQPAWPPRPFQSSTLSLALRWNGRRIAGTIPKNSCIQDPWAFQRWSGVTLCIQPRSAYASSHPSSGFHGMTFLADSFRRVLLCLVGGGRDDNDGAWSAGLPVDRPLLRLIVRHIILVARHHSVVLKLSLTRQDPRILRRIAQIRNR